MPLTYRFSKGRWFGEVRPPSYHIEPSYILDHNSLPIQDHVGQAITDS